MVAALHRGHLFTLFLMVLSARETMPTPCFQCTRTAGTFKPSVVSVCQRWSASLLICFLLAGASQAAGDEYGRMAAELSKAAVRQGTRRVAILPFQEVGAQGGNAGMVVSEKLIAPLLAEGRVEVVERTLLQSVLREQRLQASGAADSQTIKEIGKVLGVDAIVSGTVLALKNDRVEVNARLIDAQTARVLSVATGRVEKDWAEPEFGSPFAVSVPPLSSFENDEVRDSVADDDQNCQGVHRRAAELERSLLDLKARYWAARLKSPGFSRASLTTNPGSEIEDLGLRDEFYTRLKQYYRESPAPVSDGETERLSAGEDRLKQLKDLCPPDGA
jgi:TolB-like protein